MLRHSNAYVFAEPAIAVISAKIRNLHRISFLCYMSLNRTQYPIPGTYVLNYPLLLLALS
ncbi:hypothetical protein BAQU_0633 [Bifidobacterium aquikefiri]|uniref:Uncharacterized protein n=1 Tax=Bifidobacterium aquikefiri TaxID=1653207 RepID=A0A261G974_9BIFI|nr:hypothetical protein BAQU_0633 [Bifidobacterium aquikefiri]